MTENNLQIQFEKWLSENNNLLLNEFENWLHDNFNVNIDDKGVRHYIFDNYDYPKEFRLLKHDNKSFISYYANGQFTSASITPYNIAFNTKRKLYQQIALDI